MLVSGDVKFNSSEGELSKDVPRRIPTVETEVYSSIALSQDWRMQSCHLARLEVIFRES